MWALFANEIGTSIVIAYVLVAVIIAMTGLSASYKSFEDSISKKTGTIPPKLLIFFVSHRKDKDGTFHFDYPIRLGLSIYNLVVNAIATIVVSFLWIIGVALIAIPYLCNVLYNLGKPKIPVLRHLDN